MFTQIAIGTLIIAITAAISSLMVALGDVVFNRIFRPIQNANRLLRTTLALTLVTVWVVMAFTITMWLWALTFYYLEIFDSLEACLYFSMVSFTTLGFGDIILPEEWRLLSGFIATNGFILFGLGTAFIFEIMKEKGRPWE